MAQVPSHLIVEAVAPGHDKWEHLLDLSTCSDTVDLTHHFPAVPQVGLPVYLPRYDYRKAYQVERCYNRARWYYKCLNPRDTRA